MERGGSAPTSVISHPAISANSRLGTLRLTTTGEAGGSATSPATNTRATSAATGHLWFRTMSIQPGPAMPQPVTARLTGEPDKAPVHAARQALTVHEAEPV